MVNILKNNQRDYALDFVKGFLVQTMVLYHSINYFRGVEHIVLDYIDFVTGSFIFLSGYIVSSIYLQKYGNDWKFICKRLMTRGFKIILIFSVVNIVLNLTLKTNYNKVEMGIGSFLGNLSSVYIYGNGRLAAFEILLPIAYVLMLSGLMIYILRNRLLVIATVVMLFAYCLLAESVPFNLLYMSIGMNGLALGYTKLDKRKVFYEGKSNILSTVVLVSLYGMAITIFEKSAWLYFLGIIAVVSALFVIGRNLDYSKQLNRTFIILGQYSLAAYLFQIFILQILRRMSWFYSLPVVDVAIAFAITSMFIILFCVSIIYLRQKNNTLNVMYKLVFN